MTDDMSAVIAPKSDQISADDFIAGPRSFTIDAVRIMPGAEQPVEIKLVGEDRVWRPCKSMNRVLVNAWGPDAKAYFGRSVTLYRDPKVKFGGAEVGGIRISHMSHIERDLVMQLTATRAKRSSYVVKPLAVAPAEPAEDRATKWADSYVAAVADIQTTQELAAFANSKAVKLAELQSARPELHIGCIGALEARRAELNNPHIEADPEEWGQ